MIRLFLLMQIFIFAYPKNVNELKPSDISCFGVIGDSITAGFSLESHSIFRDLFEYRGKSFSIGGEKGFRTIPNLFSEYGSPKKCASYGSTFITHSISQYPTSTFKSYSIYINDSEEVSHSLELMDPSKQVKHPNPLYPLYPLKQDPIHEINCNVAISGAISQQTLYMWNKLKNEWSNFKCEEDWKLLTIMIGANDICQYCLSGYNNTINSYIFNMEQLFQNIIKDYQNIFVNVVSTFDVALTANWQNKGCEIVHQLINECPCILGRDKTSDYDVVVKKLFNDINSLLYPLVKKYDKIGTLKNIKFVIQPIMEDFQIYNSSYLSTLDCFHPSAFGHELLATILWNNLFLPPEKKIKNMPYMLPLHIPGENDFLQ